MPANQQSRKRKQPASPSPTSNRPSPYHPTGDPQRNSNRGGGAGRGRRQSSISSPTPHHHAPAQSPQPPLRNPSRLNLSTNNALAPASAPSTEDQDILIDSPPPSPSRDVYCWEYITDDVVRDWHTTGSREFKQKLTDLIGGGKDNLETSIALQEIIKAAIDSRLDATDVGRFLGLVVQENGGEQGLLAAVLLEAVFVFEPPERSGTDPPAGLVTIVRQIHPHAISEKALALRLDEKTLTALGFVTQIFSKKAIRLTTSLVYKQRKHNLLREETEGFSKLVTEFFTASYSAAPLEVVGRTGERVKGLIGAFELDPSRVLDILLDTAACTVVSNARFFVRLLRGSAWWPQQLQGAIEEDITKGRDDTPLDKEKEKERSDGEFFDKLRSEGTAAFFEKFDHPKGNRVAAQLLGFKFRYYQRDDVREQTPENLLVLSALLIKIGFIDLADLYPHLAPYDDAGMNKILEAWRTKLDEKTRGTRRNALMMAGALADDTVPAPRPSKPSTTDEKKPTEEPKREEEPKPKKDDNQKIVLLKYLLAMGALPEALFILGKYPWLPGPSEDITEHLGRVIMQSIDGVYQPLRVATPTIGSKKTAAATTTGKMGGVELFDQPRRKPMVTFTVSNLKLKTGDIEYRFFWEEWKDGVPICRNAADVVLLMKTLGKMLGVRIGRDPGVFSRVCRIGRSVLKSETCTQADRDSWIELARTLLVPAVSLTDGNQGVVNEVWRLLECFPTKTRYTLYGEWVSVTNKKHPELKAKVMAVEKETKDLLKRISKTTVRQMARQLAKIATSNPVTVMQVVLGQVEGYDNLIECVVDAARYFTKLGFDVVGFCVLNSMSNEGKQRVQADGMLTSRWLQSLSVFCGKIYTRYHREMDPGPILEYVARQLKRNHSVELIVLQQIVQSMAGINPESNLNDAQLQALAGGELLRNQVLKAFRDKKAEDSPETMKTLTHTLSSQHLAAELLVLIAQERQTCIFRLVDENAPLKVLANLFDEIHLVLSQYLDVMKMGFTPEQYDQAVPDVISLCSKYGIEPAVSWWISRLGIRSRMKKLESPDGEDVEMKDATPTATSESTDTPASIPTPAPAPTPEKRTPWNPVLAKIMQDIKPVLPEQVWAKLSAGFYVTFWQLEIYDIFVPMDAYQAENNRVNVAIRALDLDRSDPSVPGQMRKRERREELMNLNSSLQAELKSHIKENGLIRKRLNAEKDHWFKDENINQRDITDTFIQYCLFPRVMLSPNDATFCSKFIREVHRMGTPKFHTIGVYDAIFGKGLGTVIFICTQREAENFGRFLKECLSDLHGWHGDRALYEREAHGQQKGLVGFTVKGQPFDWEDFRKILYKWHKALHSAVKNCLSSKEYMHIRNAIVVLKHVAEFFPAIDWIGRVVVEKVELLVKTEKREDLKIAATTLLGMLKRRADDWVVMPAFQKSDAHTPAGAARPINSPTPANATLNTAGNTRPASPASGQLQQQQQARTLSAVATEFKPGFATAAPKATPTSAPSRAPPTSVPLPIKPETGDKEDGEIDDSRNRRPLPPQNSLPQRPQLSQMDQRKPGTPVRDLPQHLQDSGRGSGSRALTPRRDDLRPNNDVRRQPDRNELNRTPVPPRGPISQAQHQLPERPDIPRQSTLERRDVLRDSPRNDTRGRPDGRLPDKPIERRHSPRRDGRDMRDQRDRHEQDPRGSMGRDRDFSRPMIPQQWDDRSQRKDERMLEQPRPEGPRTVQSGARALQQIIESEERKRDDRDGRRSRGDRHDSTGQQPGRLNDYPMDRPERVDRTDHVDHRIPERKPEPIPARLANEPILTRHHSQEDLHGSRTPPVGPRGRGFERDRAGPPPQQQQQKERELFAGSQAGNQPRAPPTAPSHPSDQFRDTRHPAPGSFHHQDLNHGRLNPPSDMNQNIPRGPRNNPPYGSHNARGSMSIRGASAAAVAAQAANSQPSAPPQSQPPAISTPIRQPPTPTAVDTSVRKPDMPPPSERVSQSAPATPTVDTAGIHPDRLKKLGVDTALPPRPAQAASASATSSPVNPQPPRGPREDSSTPKQTSPPTGPARREAPNVDEERNRRRRIQIVQSHLGQEERNRSSRRNGSTSTPVQLAPTPPQDRRISTTESRRSSAVSTPTAEVPPPVTERSSRHHRSERGDRSERDRRMADTERDRERDRDRDRDRKSDRGEREHRRERERGRERSGRGEKHPRDSTGDKERRDSGREREGRERDEKRRRRGGDWGGGSA